MHLDPLVGTMLQAPIVLRNICGCPLVPHAPKTPRQPMQGLHDKRQGVALQCNTQHNQIYRGKASYFVRIL